MKKKYTFEPIANNNQPGCEFGYRFEATEYNPSYDYCTHFLNLRKVQIILENKFPSIKFSKPLPHHFRFDAAADEAYFQLWYPNNWVEVNTSL